MLSQRRQRPARIKPTAASQHVTFTLQNSHHDNVLKIVLSSLEII